MTDATILTNIIRAAEAGGPVNVAELLHNLDQHQLRRLVVDLAEQLAATAPSSVDTEHDPDRICAQATRLAAVAFGVSVDAVTTRDRHRPVTDARAVAQTVARNCGLTLPAVGSYFGQHHTTVMHSLDKVAGTPRLAAAAAQITTRLEQAAA